MKKVKVFIFIFLFFYLQSFSFEKKYIIGVLGSGFFSEFFGVLRNIIGCEKKRLVPVVYWDHRSPYYVDKGNRYNNVWEYYFEPVSNLKFEKADKINRIPYDEISSFFPSSPYIEWQLPNYVHNFDYNFRKYMNSIIRKYIRIKKSILEKVNFFYKKYMKGKKIIGVHIRGTNKILESPPVDINVFLKVVSRYKKHKIFIASDEHAIVKKFKKAFPQEVICYDAHRSSDSSPHYLGTDKKNPLNAIIGEEVLIETMLLSKCDLFVHSVSNVSTVVLFFNPELKHIFLDPNKF